MTHYFCKGVCKGVLAEIGVCEIEGCDCQWEMMSECECLDGSHGLEESEDDAVDQVIVKDSNGNLLKDGDSVALIKDLTLRGSSTTLKVGTKVKNIKLTDDSQEIDCKVNGMEIVLRAEFLKKL